jgi:hypothetical protein
VHIGFAYQNSTGRSSMHARTGISASLDKKISYEKKTQQVQS